MEETSTHVRRLAAIASVGALLVTLAACSALGPEESPDPGGEPLSLTFTSFQSRDVPFNVAAVWFMDEVTARTDGRITFEQHFDGTLVPAIETKNGIADGRADLGTMTHAYSPADFPLSLINDVPDVGWIGNVPAQSATVNALVDEIPEFQQEFEQNGLHMLSFGAIGQIMIAAMEEPTDVDWLRGRTVRGSAGALQWLAGAGANTVAIPIIEAYEALERGTIDATTGLTLDTGVPLGIHEVAPYWVDPGIGSAGGIELVFSLDTWNSLSEDDQSLITGVAADYPAQLAEATLEVQTEACQAILDEGGEVIDWPVAEKERFRELLGSALTNPWVAAASAAGFADPQGLIDRAAELFEQNVEEYDFPMPAELCESVG